MDIRIKRIYDPPAPADGIRILVDRLWPRGVKKQDAAVDVWAKDLAPTTELRKWFNHQESKFKEFRLRYRAELEAKHDQMDIIKKKANGRPVTLLYAARDRSRNHAVVLQEYFAKRTSGSTRSQRQ